MTRAAYYREQRRRRFGLWVQWRTGCLIAMSEIVRRRCADVPEVGRRFAMRALRDAWMTDTLDRHHAWFRAYQGWAGHRSCSAGQRWGRDDLIESWAREGMEALVEAGLLVVEEEHWDRHPRPASIRQPNLMIQTWTCWLDYRPLFGVDPGAHRIVQPLWLRGVTTPDSS